MSHSSTPPAPSSQAAGPVPSAADLVSRAHVVSLPMVTRFRGITTREALLLEGPVGWSEFSPFVEYDDREAAVWLRAAIDFGWRQQPRPQRERVPVNATVPALPAAEVAALLSRYPGCRSVKVKVAEPGQSLDDDVARVEAVRREAGQSRIRVDANGRWGVAEAVRAITALSPYGLEYVEQPCATVAELAAVRERVRGLAPIAADESIRKTSDPYAVAREGAADVIIVKAQPQGGVHQALATIAQVGLPAVVSSAIDTSVGLAMGAWLAAALPRLEHDCGLGTAALLGADVTHLPLVPEDGSIPVRRVTPDAALLEEHQASPERRDWWLDRLRRCAALL
ncbi:MAG TPA: o-succinylbenzoate synthase [Microbacteriaceae bacterium]|nr:o-succinylbenzoate synthase [Microbacteriaceae bacterium]